tara:strand:- start:26 stop:178 length:153 start_codon:yes stop_codon:yes gene_type:complete
MLRCAQTGLKPLLIIGAFGGERIYEFIWRSKITFVYLGINNKTKSYEKKL